MAGLFRINTNISALFAQRQLGRANSKLQEANQRLSSGLRINSAADDAAGLAVSQKMETQIRGLAMGSRNAQDGLSMLQTAEGALSETQDMIQRMRELAIQASNDTLTPEDRDKIQKEVNNLAIEIQRVADDTEFNERKLLNGTLQNAQFQVGANEGQRISFSIGDLGTEQIDEDSGKRALNIAEFSKTDKTVDSIGAVTSAVSGGDDITSADDGTYEVVRKNGDELVIQDSSGTTVAKSITSTKNEGVVFQGTTANSGSGFGDDKVIFEAAVKEGKFDISGGTVQTSTIEAQELEDGKAGTNLEAGTYTVESTSTAGVFNLVDEDGNIVGTTFGSNGNAQGTFFDPSNSSQVVLTYSSGTGFSVNSGSFSGTGVFTGDEEITVGGPNISQSLEKAENAIGQLDEALSEVSEERTDIGALINRLENTIDVNKITKQNTQAARSRIRDANIAKESVKRTRANILIQASTSVLAQANQNPQLALQLLGG